MKNKCKIGINARTFTIDNPGGAVQVGKQLTNKLISDPDIDTHLYGHSKLEEEFTNPEIHTSGYIFESQLYGLAWEKMYLPFCNFDDIDVLFCPNGNGPLVETNVPVVMYIHDVNAILGHSSKFYNFYRRMVIPRAAKVADAIVTVSKFSKDELLEVLDVPDSKVSVVHNGLDSRFLSDTEGDPIDLPNNYVLYVGQLNPRKNIRMLIESFKKFKSMYNVDHKLVLVGPGNRSIFKSIEVEEEDDIIHMGYVSDQNLKYIYRKAGVFLFPSLHEGFGLPPLEAMASGTPVISSKRGALSEVLDSHPIYIDPESKSDIATALCSILIEGEYSHQRQKAAKEYAQGFTWDNAESELKSVFEKVV